MAVKSTTEKVAKTAKTARTAKTPAHRTPRVKKAAKPEIVPKLRIRVRAYEHKILDASIKKYTVNRASFVYKNAREQFEMRVHKRLIDIINPTPRLIEALTNLSLPS